MEEYDAYIKMARDFEDAEMMLNTETDPDMREMLKEESQGLREKLAESEEKLKLLMLPKIHQ